MFSKNIFLFLVFSLILAGSMAVVNYFIDASCYYHCADFDLQKRTINPYYQIVQMIDMAPGQDIVIVGSSRARTTSSKYIAQKTGLRVLNISAPAADLALRQGYLERVLSTSDRVPQRVVWYADFIELSVVSSEPKVIAVDAFKNKMGIYSDDTKIFKLQKLIDRLSFEASLKIFFRDPSVGYGYREDEVDLDKCLAKDFSGLVTPSRFEAELGLMYANYLSSVFKDGMTQDLQLKFEKNIKDLVNSGIQVDIVITPYHPAFKRRLQKEHPEIYEYHLEWVKYLKGFSEGEMVKVHDYFTNGFKNDEGGPLLWDDGVHFNCLAAIRIVNEIF